MFKRKLLVLFSVCCLSPNIVAANPDSATLLIDLISFLKVPLKVALFTCWPEDKSVSFSRKLLSVSNERLWFVQMKSDSIENLSVLDTPEPHQQLVVVDVSCPRADDFLIAAGYRIYHKVRWVLLDENMPGDESDHERRIFKTAKKLPITGCSEVFYFVKDDNGEVSIKDVFRISMNENITTSLIGIWRNGTIEDKRSSKAVSARRRNLHRLPLRTTLGYSHNNTLSHFDDYSNSHYDKPNRVAYLVLKALYHSYLNATFKKRYASSYCYPKPEGTEQSDMCADILYNRSDIGGTPVYMIQERLKMVEYTQLPFDLRSAAIFKTPKLSITDNIFRLPFDGNVWGCLIGLILFMGGLFLGASVAQRRFGSKVYQNENLFDAVFETVPIAMQQGLLNDAKTLAKRTLMLVSLIGLMFFEVSFSAKIVSLIQAPSERIASLKDLLDSRLEVGSHNTSYNNYWLSNLAEPVRKALFLKKIRNKDGSVNMIPMEEGMMKIRKEPYAFHVLLSTAYDIISDTFDEAEKCYLKELPWIPTSEGFILMKQNFTWCEHFHVGLMRIREMGINSREYYRMNNAKPKCVSDVRFEPLTAIDLRFALELMCWGMGATILIFLIEKIWRAYYVWRLPVFEYVE